MRDGMYMVAGGVPDRCQDHAHKMAGLALEMVELAGGVANPVTGGVMSVRIGEFIVRYIERWMCSPKCVLDRFS